MVFLQIIPVSFDFSFLLILHVNPVEKDSAEINKLAEEVFAHLSLLLRLESLQKMHGEIRLGTRMNYYPSCCRGNLVVGVSPHSDGRSLTFLLQDDEITSLQIKHRGKMGPRETDSKCNICKHW